jgi:hypothetical protein
MLPGKFVRCEKDGNKPEGIKCLSEGGQDLEITIPDDEAVGLWLAMCMKSVGTGHIQDLIFRDVSCMGARNVSQSIKADSTEIRLAAVECKLPFISGSWSVLSQTLELRQWMTATSNTGKSAGRSICSFRNPLRVFKSALSASKRRETGTGFGDQHFGGKRPPAQPDILSYSLPTPPNVSRWYAPGANRPLYLML